MTAAGCKWGWRAAAALALGAWCAHGGPALAQATADGGAAATTEAAGAQPGAASALDFDAPDTDVEMAPTELGVRFTPGMAKAIARQMARQMKGRYDLTDAQQQQAQEILSKNLMKMAQSTQRISRDSWELFMENMIANEGSFGREDGQRWAKMMTEFVPEMKKFMTTSASQIGKHLTLSQRLKLSAEMAAVSAGVATFEERMKRWSNGDMPDMANPFFDAPRSDAARRDERRASARRETEEVSRARARADRRLEWETNVEDRWSAFCEMAIEYYEFNEAQAKSAKVILKECLERAKQVKSPDWLERMRRNRTAAGLGGGLGRQYREGPWMWQIDREYEELLKPLQDLGRELRTRIDELADSTQREKAASRVRQRLEDSGMDVQTD